jgi:drug/metabolite transporter (DMT)-like permease
MIRDELYADVLRYSTARLASSRASAYGAIALAALLWGSLGTLAKLLFRARVTPLALVSARLTLAALLLGLWLAWRDRRALAVARGDLPLLVTLGAVGMGVMNLFYFRTLELTNVATAFLLQYLSPFLVLAGSALVLKERIARRTYGALLLCVVGLYLVATSGDPRALAVNWRGLATGLVAASLFALFNVLGKRAMRTYGPLTTLFYTFLFGAAACWLGMPPWRLPSLGWDGATWLGLVAVVVVATVLPFGLYFWGMRRLEPTRAVLTLSMEAVFAAAVAWVVIGEALSPWQIAGGALVLGAVAWLNSTPDRA